MHWDQFTNLIHSLKMATQFCLSPNAEFTNKNKILLNTSLWEPDYSQIKAFLNWGTAVYAKARGFSDFLHSPLTIKNFLIVLFMYWSFRLQPRFHPGSCFVYFLYLIYVLMDTLLCFLFFVGHIHRNPC